LSDGKLVEREVETEMGIAGNEGTGKRKRETPFERIERDRAEVKGSCGRG